VTTTAPVTTANVVDLHGLERLRHRAAQDESAAVTEAAVQFEALFIGMMLESARSARLGSGLLDGAQTKQYLDLMDQQVALEMARNGGLGFGRMLVEQLSPGSAPPVMASASSTRLERAPVSRTELPPAVEVVAPGEISSAFPSALPPSLRELATHAGEPARPPDAADAERFVERLLPQAREAAAALGVEPRVLLAQAALETGWGKSLESSAAPAHNLFGIKAGGSWTGGRTAHWTMEQGAAGLERRREAFRAYESTAASFSDYVDLISSAPRYAAALESRGDAEGYVRAIADGGYATDPEYADKWLAIYHGERLAGALRNVSTE
jgi:flagellar protein FlgJ